jgi:hypothetical protein
MDLRAAETDIAQQMLIELHHRGLAGAPLQMAMDRRDYPAMDAVG